jgi:hypothetical protein
LRLRPLRLLGLLRLAIVGVGHASIRPLCLRGCAACRDGTVLLV